MILIKKIENFSLFVFVQKKACSGVNGHWGNSNLMSWTSVLFNSYLLTRSH